MPAREIKDRQYATKKEGLRPDSDGLKRDVARSTCFRALKFGEQNDSRSTGLDLGTNTIFAREHRSEFEPLRGYGKYQNSDEECSDGAQHTGEYERYKPRAGG